MGCLLGWWLRDSGTQGFAIFLLYCLIMSMIAHVVAQCKSPRHQKQILRRLAKKDGCSYSDIFHEQEKPFPYSLYPQSQLPFRFHRPGLGHMAMSIPIIGQRTEAPIMTPLPRSRAVPASSHRWSKGKTKGSLVPSSGSWCIFVVML